MTQRLDGISKLKNCPTMGDDIRRAIAESRKKELPQASEDEEEDSLPDQIVVPANMGDLRQDAGE
jgi:hypothetical protein